MTTMEQLINDAMCSADTDEMGDENIADGEEFGEETDTDDVLGADDKEN